MQQQLDRRNSDPRSRRGRLQRGNAFGYPPPRGSESSGFVWKSRAEAEKSGRRFLVRARACQPQPRVSTGRTT